MEQMPLIDDCIQYSCTKYGGFEYKEDLKGDLLVNLLEYNNEKLNKVVYEDNAFNAFVTACLKRQLYSKNSRFFYKYKRYDNNKRKITKGITDCLADIEDNYTTRGLNDFNSIGYEYDDNKYEREQQEWKNGLI